ncbi:MAG: rhodanese-like domain-containing protein [Gemmataceae bacterium]
MRTFLLLLGVAGFSYALGQWQHSPAMAQSQAAASTPPSAVVVPSVPADNPSIDMQGYLKLSTEAAEHRKARRVSEADFIKMSQEPGTIILDARSKDKFDLLHIRGAVNLPFPDIDTESLPRVLPEKTARILIYCNNNFTPAPGTAPNVGNPPPKDVPSKFRQLVQNAFMSKRATASLNLSTYIALYSYGYKNVYELAPLVDADATKLELVSSAKK